MELRIRAYIDSLFRGAPPSQQAVELKEEMIQNLFEKYYDLIENGKSPEAAYNVTVASIGDISQLLSTIEGYEQNAQPVAPFMSDAKRKKSAIIVAIAVGLYITCVIPAIAIPGNVIGPILMFLMVAVATGMLIYNGAINKQPAHAESVVDDFKQWRQSNGTKNTIYNTISSVLTALTLVFYFVISFSTGAWYITWLIFLVSSAIHKVIKVIIFEIIG